MKKFKQYISEIAKGIYKGFGMLIIDGQKVDVEVELYGTDNKNNTFLTRIVDIDKKYQKTHPIGKEVAIPAKTFRRGRWVKVKTPNAFETRDYKAEYKKHQSSPERIKYRAELVKYNRDKGTYGNGDGKDAFHKDGKIVGFEAQSKNRGRVEASRIKGSKRKVDENENI